MVVDWAKMLIGKRICAVLRRNWIDSEGVNRQFLCPLGFFRAPIPYSREESFEALYKSWRAGAIPFFYFCASNFTALFLDAREETGGAWEGGLEREDSLASVAWAEDAAGTGLRAILSPSTHGLRAALRDEGVELVTPLRPDSRRNSANRRRDSNQDSNVAPELARQSSLLTQSQPPIEFQVGEVEEEELDQSAEDPSKWLDEVDISPTTVQKFRRAISENRLSSGSGGRDSLGAEDPTKSACLVQGRANLQGLFNWLVGTRTAATVSGPQAGLPPTLLSPAPFLGTKVFDKSPFISVLFGSVSAEMDFWKKLYVFFLISGLFLLLLRLKFTEICKKHCCERVLNQRLHSGGCQRALEAQIGQSQAPAASRRPPEYWLELSGGPILPHLVFRLARLAAAAQPDHEFTFSTQGQVAYQVR